MTVTLKEHIKYLVRIHGSLRGVSRVTGVDVGYLSRLASGKKEHPSTVTLGKLGLCKAANYEIIWPLMPNTNKRIDK